jgi:probable rRNA maturation factor
MSDGPDPRRLRVALTDASGRAVRAGALGAWLRDVAPSRARGAVTIALVADATMRRLNKKFAGTDKATDVLSFPTRDRGPQGPRHTEPCLGDIVIATGIARRQARAAGHSYARELRVLALHGLLHLLGYDHETDGGTMSRVEERLRRKGGLQAGVIERARIS